jgi:hypothetical protein
MESAITALKDTPIPTILVVAGIAFLLLAIAGQLAGRIVVAPERQRWAAVIGGGLLAIGIALHVVPLVRVTSPATDRVPTSRPSTSPIKEPPPQPSGGLPTTQPPPSMSASIVSAPPSAEGPVELYRIRIRTDYWRPSNVEFSVFVNDVQVGSYSSDRATADITRFIKPGAHKVRIAWTADPNMGIYADLIIEVKQGERWTPLITR